MAARHWLGLVLALTAPAAAQAAEVRPDIVIDDSAVFPENIAAARDGTLWMGSVAKGAIYRALPGKKVATVWIAAGTADMRQSMGLWADERRGLLWVCVPGARAKDGRPADATAIKTFDLKSGAFRASYGFDGGGRCNDLTIAADGTVYASDFDGGRLLRLAAGDTMFRVLAADPRLASIDGLAIAADGQLYVNTYRTGRLFRIAIAPGAAPGAIEEIMPERPLVKPDGMRAVGDRLVLAEGEGRLVELAIEGTVARVRLLLDGMTDSPASVVVTKGKAYVVQAKWAAMADPTKDAGLFGAVAIPYRQRK